MSQVNDVTGIIPAAGFARRLGPLPYSKEVLPLVGRNHSLPAQETLPLACDHALDALRHAGIERAFVLLREGKWDIPAALGDGSRYGVSLAYRVVGATPGVPHTLDRAFPFIKDQRIVLAFPDLLFEPRTALKDLLHQQLHSGADIVLGTFPAPDDQSADFVDVRDGQVRSIHVKPDQTTLQQAWIVALWTPVFTRFLHAFIASKDDQPLAFPESESEELHLGSVFQAAITQGVQVAAVAFPQGKFLDIGTPEKLRRAMRGHW